MASILTASFNVMAEGEDVRPARSAVQGCTDFARAYAQIAINKEADSIGEQGGDLIDLPQYPKVYVDTEKNSFRVTFFGGIDKAQYEITVSTVLDKCEDVKLSPQVDIDYVDSTK